MDPAREAELAEVALRRAAAIGRPGAVCGFGTARSFLVLDQRPGGPLGDWERTGTVPFERSLLEVALDQDVVAGKEPPG
jgi:hypothetical protein